MTPEIEDAAKYVAYYGGKLVKHPNDSVCLESLGFWAYRISALERFRAVQ